MTYVLEIGTGIQPVVGEFIDPVRLITGSEDEDPTTPNIIEYTLKRDDRLDPGDYRWHVRAVDQATNASAFSGGREFRVAAAVDLVLVPNIQEVVCVGDDFLVRAGSEFDVTIMVEPNGQPVSVLDAFLDFPAELELVSIETVDGPPGEVLLTRDDEAGQVDFAATTTGVPPTEPFDLAVARFRAKELPRAVPEVVAPISFHREFPRRTEAAFDGDPVLGNAFGVQVTILKPIVEIRLHNDKFFNTESEFQGFARNETFDVTAMVEPHG